MFYILSSPDSSKDYKEFKMTTIKKTTTLITKMKGTYQQMAALAKCTHIFTCKKTNCAYTLDYLISSGAEDQDVLWDIYEEYKMTELKLAHVLVGAQKILQEAGYVYSVVELIEEVMDCDKKQKESNPLVMTAPNKKKDREPPRFPTM